MAKRPQVKPARGVDVRANSIRVTFTYEGRQYRETLTINGEPMAPTQANVAHATRLAARIRSEIELGVFSLAEHFPDSKTLAGATDLAPTTLGGLADAWLASKGDLAPATRSQYANAVIFWKGLLGEDTPIRRITHALLLNKINAHAWPSNKLRNNYLIALRGALGVHFRGRLAVDNPIAGIENGKTTKQPPDPLTIKERDAVLADMRKHYDPRIVAYFTFAFFTGMRPEEIIALRWESIDWRACTARVERVRTFKGSEREETKTRTDRDVDLVPQAIEALKVMKQYTFLKRDEDGAPADVFENPVTRRHWHDERSQRDHYWKPTLKRLGIRARRAYCTRHTYCTAALMAGVKPAYIASQAGHSVAVLLKTYARWIPGGDDGTEKQRLAAAMAGDLSPDYPREAAR